MTNETERKVVKRAARGMRAAALRLALERAGQESDPTLAYGCVDWFRYDAPAQSQETDTPVSPAAARHGETRGEASLRH
jgi:hypothetical protein